jgi:hypothetical protein
MPQRIIVKTSIMTEIFHKYNIAVVDQPRSNLGRVTIWPGDVDFETAENKADVLRDCAIAIAKLGLFSENEPSQQELEQKRDILYEALVPSISEDSDHDDQGLHRDSFAGSVTGSRIRERNIACSQGPSSVRK